VSNLFVIPGAGRGALDGCIALAAALFPADPIVGYESGAALDAALAHGFEDAGPLRIWINEG
jgi:hypothetical protein